MRTYLASLLLALFCCYFSGVSMFSHVHIVHGGTGVHSHFGGSSEHNHSDGQYAVIDMLSDLTVGLEYNEDYLRDNMWGYNRVTEQTVRIVSAYAQNEWKNAQWGILIGGRLDKHNLIKGVIFSPRANLRYNPTENINLRASYSYGFRAPQAFDEDLHIDNVGGTVSMIRLADDLRVEKSQSVSVSADLYHSWGDWQGNILIEGFFTDLDDVFALKEIGFEMVGGKNTLIKERHNESGARVFGGNLEGKVAWKNIVQVQLGVTAQSSNYKEARFMWHLQHLQELHTPAQRRNAEHLQFIPEGFRFGSRQRLGLHVRPYPPSHRILRYKA